MKYMLMILLFCLPFVGFADSHQSLSNISELRWKNRLIIVLTDHSDNGFKSAFDQYTFELDDRDVFWFVLDKSNTETNYPGLLSKDFLINTKDRFNGVDSGVFLIGKDGGLKVMLQILNLQRLFQAIDAMPMRQIEMQNRV